MNKTIRKPLLRAVVFASDIENITGLSAASGRRILRNIKRLLNKNAAHFVTADEFCEVTGIDIEVVREYLKL